MRAALIGPGAVVLLATLALLAMDLACVALWGRNIPLAEDWVMVRALAGQEPDLAGWLWAQNNEHRLPLPKLLYWGLLEVARDFRVGMVVNQLALAGLALVLARAAWVIRGGRSSYLDLFLPLALLHPGHWENLVWGWQIQFVSSIVLSGMVLAILVWSPGPLGRRRAALLSLCTLLLTVSGANGLIMVIPLVPLMAVYALLRWRARAQDADAGPVALILAAGALLSVLLFVAYFIGYERPSWSPPLAGPADFFKTLGKYLAYGFGPGTRKAFWLFAPLALLLLGTALLLVLRPLTRRDPEAWRAWGLFAFAAACGGMAVAIAAGRGASELPITDRYALLSTLSLLAAWFAWILYAPGRLRRALPVVALLVLLIALPANLLAARSWRNWYDRGMQAVERDLAADLAIEPFVERHAPFLLRWSPQNLHSSIGLLRELRWGPFDDSVLIVEPAAADPDP